MVSDSLNAIPADPVVITVLIGLAMAGILFLALMQRQ